MKRTSSQHRNILEALKSRDPLAAESAIQEHLTASRKNVGKYEATQKSRPRVLKTEQKAKTGKRKASEALKRG
jgi:hypothetical protein